MASNRPLRGDITVTGMDQHSQVTWMQNTTDLVNELQTDHATNKTTIDALVTLTTELRTDHATNKTTMDESRTAILELIDDHDTNQTHMTNLKTLLNQLRQAQLYAALGNPAFVIDTNFDVKNGNAISYLNGGTLKTLSANSNFDTGTAATVAGSQFAAAMLTVNASGTGVVTWATAAGAGYASEAAAIAALAAPATTDTVLGYFTMQAHASGFTAGTDALATGTGGNVALATTYYNSINGNTLMIGAAVSTSSEAALAAGDPTASAATITAAAASAGPATLSNSTALTLLRA